MEKAHLELKKIFFEDDLINSNLLNLKSKEAKNQNVILSYPIFQKIYKIDNRTPYFPSRLEYLFLLVKFIESSKEELKIQKPNGFEKKVLNFNNIIRLAKEEIKDESKKIIAKNQKSFSEKLRFL